MAKYDNFNPEVFGMFGMSFERVHNLLNDCNIAAKSYNLEDYLNTLNILNIELGVFRGDKKEKELEVCYTELEQINLEILELNKMYLTEKKKLIPTVAIL